MTTIETELINGTIDALKELISRPPLTEKLLSRPPFKYILDICKAVSAATGFPSSESCNHDDITDREERTAFLTSIIAQITDQLGVPVDIQIKSILAGKDVPKTLRMLVMLAQAAKLFKVRSNSSQPPPQQAPKEVVASPPQEDLEALAREKAEKERQRREQEQQERERRERERQEKEREEREKRELEAREQAEKERQKQKQQQQQQQQQQSAISLQKSPPKVRFADDEKTGVEEHQPVIERPHFNRPPPSQHSRRMAVTATSESSVPQPSAMRLVKVVREESSDESNQDLVQATNQDGGFTIGLDAEWCDEILPGELSLETGAPSGTHGELVTNILDTAEEYNVALHGDGSKKPTGLSSQRDKKSVDSHSQPIQKLISHISTIIRKSVPYTKHTAFLDEHILTMRTELHTASEAVTKLLSTNLKQQSSLKQANNACESKLHSLKEQICSLRQTQLELLHSTLVL